MTTKSIHRNSILEALFTSKARLEILKLFFLSSSERHYMRQVAALTGQPIRAVQRELERLKDAGLLESRREGKHRYFEVNRNSPVFLDLRSLFVKTAGLAPSLRDNLLQEVEDIRSAFIFGSYASGSESITSDLDLMVVGDITGRDLARALKPAREMFGREINAVIMPVDELRRKAAQGESFIINVLNEPKIFLIGGEDELKEIAGAGTP